MASLVYSASRTGGKITVAWATMTKAPESFPNVDGEHEGDFGDWFQLPASYTSMEASINGAVVNPRCIMEVAPIRGDRTVITQAEESTGVPWEVTQRSRKKPVITRPTLIRPHYRRGSGPMDFTLVITI